MPAATAWLKQHIHLWLILAAPLAMFWRWLLNGEVLYWGTLLLQFWPWHHLVKTSLLAGTWPLWNPLLGNGTPLLANLQSAVLYPPNLIFLLMPVEHALTASIMLHLMLAGGLMYAYTRQLGLTNFGATVSAFSYMFSGYIIGRTQFIPMVHAAAWLPLLLLLADRLAARRRPADFIALAMALALQLLAGHAQLWSYSVGLVGLYGVYRGWHNNPTGYAKQNLVGRIIHLGWPLAAAIAGAMLLAAAQILPTAELLSLSQRSEGVDRHLALTYSYWPWRLITLLAPDFFGRPDRGNYWGYANYWEDHAYLGVLPLLLAGWAIWHYWRHRSRLTAPAWRLMPFFSMLIPATLLLAMGWHTPLYPWLYDYVPGFRTFQAPARLMLLPTVALTVLAGIGADHFAIPPRQRGVWKRLLAAALAVLTAGLAGAVVITGRSASMVTAVMQAGALLALAVGLLLARPATISARQKRWQAGVVALVAIDLLLAGWPLLPSLPPEVYRLASATAGLIKAQPDNHRYFIDEQFSRSVTFDRYLKFSEFGPQTVSHWQQFKETLTPNFGVYAALPSAQNNDPLVVGHWQQFNRLAAQGEATTRARLVRLTGATQFVGRGQEQPDWPNLLQQDGLAIQTVPHPLPPAYFVSRAIGVRDAAEAAARLTGPDFDSLTEVIIIDPETEPPATLAVAVPALPVTIATATASTLQLTVDAPSAGYVVLTDTYYPGWQAWVDGRETVIKQANLAFRAVPVTAGRHQLTFEYWPRSFSLGLWLSSMAWGGALMALFLWRGNNNKQTRKNL